MKYHYSLRFVAVLSVYSRVARMAPSAFITGTGHPADPLRLYGWSRTVLKCDHVDHNSSPN
jgi:hypothetical protein